MYLSSAPSDPSFSFGDNFGSSVVVSGSVAVVGAPQDNDNGERSGSGHVFDITTSQEIFTLLAVDADGKIGDLFGDTVAMDGSIAVIGARGDEANGSRAGAAYIFDVTLPPNPADLNGDGCVNQDDLAQLLGAWRTAHLNSDGVTNAADLAQLLGSWQAGCS